MKITCMDASVLLQNAMKAADSAKVGWLDANMTLETFRTRINHFIEVDPSVVESAISHIVELDAVKKWTHPDGIDLATFIKKITPPNKTYDYSYRCFERKD